MENLELTHLPENGRAEFVLPVSNQAQPEVVEIHVKPVAPDKAKPDKAEPSEKREATREATIAYIKNHYVRVGTQYMFRTQLPNIDGRFENQIFINYAKDAIKDDFARADSDFVRLKDPHLYVERYVGFVNIPSHTNYQEVFGTGRSRFLNQYRPIPQQPTPGECNVTLEFVRHIFGEQYEQGLEYLKVLYEKPKEKLPILCLQSRERETGKTTFLRFLRLLFGANVTLNTNEDLKSKFNSDWTGKLIIAVDETLLDKRNDSERLKNHSTAPTAKTEAKNKDKIEGDFFGKFVLCANPNAQGPFIILDPEETRYWVRKISPVPLSIRRKNLLADIEKEVPAFLHYLSNLPYRFERPHSRMWFSEKDIWTKELDELKAKNRNNFERELAMCILDYMAKFQADLQGSANLSLTNISDLMARLNMKITRSQMAVIKEKWGIDALTSRNYFFYTEVTGPNGEIMVMRNQQKDRHYVFHEAELLKIVPDYTFGGSAENDADTWQLTKPGF